MLLEEADEEADKEADEQADEEGDLEDDLENDEEDGDEEDDEVEGDAQNTGQGTAVVHYMHEPAVAEIILDAVISAQNIQVAILPSNVLEPAVADIILDADVNTQSPTTEDKPPVRRDNRSMVIPTSLLRTVTRESRGRL